MARKYDKEEFELEYTDEMLHLAISYYQKTEIAIDFLYHLVKSHKLKVFTSIILKSNYADFGSFLQKNKRKTDILFLIGEEQNTYALLCQETKVDGGVYFMKRLENELHKIEKKAEINASVVAIESSKYAIRDLLFIVFDNFNKALNGEDGPIIYRTIH